MRNGTIRIEAEKFLTNQEGRRHIDWYRAWGGTWCNNWISYGAKQAHAPAPAASVPQTGKILYRVFHNHCERQESSGDWRRIPAMPSDLIQMDHVRERGAEFEWHCSAERRAVLEAEMAAAQGRGA